MSSKDIIINIIESKGLSPSINRIKILKYLMDKKNHPTVDMLYKDLKKDIPTLSKTTVYNTLKVFLENNIVQEISIENGEKRFDANVKVHGHFKCENCGKIFDFECNVISNDARLDNFKINKKDIYFKGICKECNLILKENRRN